MAKKTKEHKPVSRAASLLRLKVAENVVGLMERRFPTSRFRTMSDRERALAKEAGCSWSTIQRVLAPIKTPVRRKGTGDADGDSADSVGTRIDTIADLAVVFGVSAADLLTPNFAHSRPNATTSRSSSEGSDERELQRPSNRSTPR